MKTTGIAAANDHGDKVSSGVRAGERKCGIRGRARIDAFVLNESDVRRRRGHGERDAVAGLPDNRDDNVARCCAGGNRHNDAGIAPTRGIRSYAVECNCARTPRSSEG